MNKRRVIKLSASFLIGLVLLSACKKEITTIGNDINPNGLTIITQDTFTVVTSSAIVSDLPTDETSVSLLGAINDPELGTVDCGIVTQLRLSSESPNFGDVSQITIDSVVLSMVYTADDFYGNLTELEFEVLVIGDDLDRDNSEYFANTAVNTVNSDLMLSTASIIKPNPYLNVVIGSDTLDPMLRLNLDPSFGTYLINNADQMGTNDNFLNFFKGLYIRVSNLADLDYEEGMVLYFAMENALSNLTLYYTIDGENKTFTFNINSNCARFNKMDFNRIGYPIEDGISNAESAQEKMYLQSSTIRPEFQFPYLASLQADQRRVINKAELIVPVQDFESSPFKPVSGLFIGRIKTALETSLTYDYPTFNTVAYDDENKEYVFNITRDLQRILSGDIENTGYRLYPINFFGSSIERIIFSGPNANSKARTKLRITYTEY